MANTRKKSFHRSPDRLNRKELFKQWIFICVWVCLETAEKISLQKQFTTKRLAVRHVLCVKHTRRALSRPLELSSSWTILPAIRHIAQVLMGDFEKMADAIGSRRRCRYREVGSLDSTRKTASVGRQEWFVYQMKRCFTLYDMITLKSH